MECNQLQKRLILKRRVDAKGKCKDCSSFDGRDAVLPERLKDRDLGACVKHACFVPVDGSCGGFTLQSRSKGS